MSLWKLEPDEQLKVAQNFVDAPPCFLDGFSAKLKTRLSKMEDLLSEESVVVFGIGL